MEFIAQSKSLKISPRKVRIITDCLRNLSVDKALETLLTTRKRATLAIEKTLRSALANAVFKAKVSKEALFIDRIEVSEGPALKRYHPSTRGRVHPYKKRSSHIRIILKEVGKKDYGTKS